MDLRTSAEWEKAGGWRENVILEVGKKTLSLGREQGSTESSLAVLEDLKSRRG
jgi:hypothetical protein